MIDGVGEIAIRRLVRMGYPRFIRSNLLDQKSMDPRWVLRQPEGVQPVGMAARHGFSGFRPVPRVGPEFRFADSKL
jgi:hypothetical protein